MYMRATILSSRVAETALIHRYKKIEEKGLLPKFSQRLVQGYESKYFESNIQRINDLSKGVVCKKPINQKVLEFFKLKPHKPSFNQRVKLLSKEYTRMYEQSGMRMFMGLIGACFNKPLLMQGERFQKAGIKIAVDEISKAGDDMPKSKITDLRINLINACNLLKSGK